MLNDRFKVLLIEDNPGDIRIIKEMFSERSQSVNLYCVENLSIGLEHIAAEHYDVILLDLSLPDSVGLETIKKVNLNKPDIPIVVLTGVDDENVAMDAISHGAQDYLSKNQINSTMLIRTIHHAIERKQTMEALQASEERYRAVFENTGTATAIVDEDMTLSLTNTKFQVLAGYTKTELEGKRSWTEFVSVYDLERMKNDNCGYTEETGPSPGSYEFKFCNRNGQERDVLAMVEIMPRTSKRIVSLLDITDQKRVEKRIRYLSFHDKLTGLHNRAFFEEELKRLDTPRQLPWSILIADVNGLKLTNDAFGHSKGDQLLTLIAQILKDSCRKEDIICRWGGDEFAVLLPETNGDIAVQVGDRIKKSCQKANKKPIQPSIALGIASKEDVSQKVEDVIAKAEDRMYRNKLTERDSSRSAIIYSLQRTLKEKTHETEEHAERLGWLAKNMGEALELSNNKLDELSLLASLHDIGKVAIPDQILNKPGKLTSKEWETMKKHPEIGFRIAQASFELSHIAESILSHHERWDGSGYPQGQKGNEIPLHSRIIAVVDAFDVMTHERPYKKATSKAEALDELRRNAGSQFDPELVETFLTLISEQE